MRGVSRHRASMPNRNDLRNQGFGPLSIIDNQVILLQFGGRENPFTAKTYLGLYVPASRLGQRTRRVVPSPSFDRTSIDPPCATTIYCEMNSPRPSPVVPFAGAAPRRKASKI